MAQSTQDVREATPDRSRSGKRRIGSPARRKANERRREALLEDRFPNLREGVMHPDLAVFGDSREELRAVKAAIAQQLAALRLRLHSGKSRIYRMEDGVTFLGWRLYPDSSRLVRGNVVRLRRRLRQLEQAYGEGTLDAAAVWQRLQSWLAHAAHGDTWRLRQQVLLDFSLTGGRRAI